METRGLPKGGAEHGGDGASPTSCLPPAAVSSTGRPMQMLAAFMLFRDSCARALRNILGTLSSSETFRRSTSPLCTRDTRRTPRAPRQVPPQAPPRQHGERTDGARTRGTEGRVSSQALVPFTERTSRLPQRKAVGADAASGRQIPASGPLPPPRSALRAPGPVPACTASATPSSGGPPSVPPASGELPPGAGRPLLLRRAAMLLAGRRGALPEAEAGSAPGAAASRCTMAGPALWRALRGARGRGPAVGGWGGLRPRPDKYGGVSVELAELRRPRRRERAAFGRWLRGKWRARGRRPWAGGVGGCARPGGEQHRAACNLMPLTASLPALPCLPLTRFRPVSIRPKRRHPHRNPRCAPLEAGWVAVRPKLRASKAAA